MIEANKITYLEFPEDLNGIKLIRLDNGHTYINRNFNGEETEVVFITSDDIKKAKEEGRKYI